MYKKIDFGEFLREFLPLKHVFSLNMLYKLFNYIEEKEPDYVLNAIDLNSQWIRFENIEDFHKKYSKEQYPTIESIKEKTDLIEVTDSIFIFKAFKSI